MQRGVAGVAHVAQLDHHGRDVGHVERAEVAAYVEPVAAVRRGHAEAGTDQARRGRAGANRRDGPRMSSV